MEKIKLSFFDTFAYLIPGILIITAIAILFNNNINLVSDIPLAFKDISTSQMLFALLASYVVGAFHFVAPELSQDKLKS